MPAFELAGGDAAFLASFAVAPSALAPLGAVVCATAQHTLTPLLPPLAMMT